MFFDALFVDPAGLDNDVKGFIQLILLGAAYGYVLFNASNVISEGSELLLLIPSLAGIVGSVVLPVLGAVPDGAIVLFSGMGPDAQEQLKVGVGALAGSTIMLLTIPWALSILAGRVNLDKNGAGSYDKKPKLTPPGFTSLTQTGVNCNPSIAVGGKIMLATTIPYFIIQGPTFAFHCSKGDDCEHPSKERYYALAGFLLCCISFVAYLVYQVKSQNSDNRQSMLLEKLNQAIDEGKISVVTAFADLLIAEQSSPGKADSSKQKEASLLLGSRPINKKLTATLKHFFKRYDKNGDEAMNIHEVGFLLRDLGVTSASGAILQRFFASLDSNADGKVDFPEFVDGMRRFIVNRATREKHQSFSFSLNGSAANLLPRGPASPDTHLTVHSEVKATDVEDPLSGDDDDDEEEEEVPEEFKDLPQKEQQRAILKRSLWMMGVGTLMVLLFSDPMVGVLNEFGKRTKLGAFYVSFVIAPLASNASELIASYNYALKKTKKTITISLSALEGAACMNNTFCLAIFLILVYAKTLAWEFSAETISIVVAQLIMYYFTQKATHRLLDALLVFSIFPLSIVFVAILENVVKLN